MRSIPLLWLAACVAPTGPSREEPSDLERELENDANRVVTAEIGSTYTGTLEPCHPAFADSHPECLHVFELDVPEGAPVVIALQSLSVEGLDLLVKKPDHTRVAHVIHQSLFTSLPSRDPFTVVGAGKMYVFVSSPGFQEQGDYAIHFAFLERTPIAELVPDSQAIEIVGESLTALAGSPHHEHLREIDDGFVEADLRAVSLGERADLTRLVYETNEARRTLFALLAERSGLATDDETVHAIGADWVMLRRTIAGFRLE
jgi:hypothetical protein